jgi:hypothetical protein
MQNSKLDAKLSAIRYLRDIQSAYYDTKNNEFLNWSLDEGAPNYIGNSLLSSEDCINFFLLRPNSRQFFAKNGVLMLRDTIFVENFFWIDSEYALISDMFDDSTKCMFTEYEDLFSKAILLFCQRTAIRALKDYGLQIDSDIVFGTMPLGHINANISKSPSGCGVIVFNSGLLSMLYILTRELALSYSMRVSDGKAFYSAESAMTLNRLDAFVAFNNYLKRGYGGDPTQDIVKYVDSPNFQMIRQTFKYICLFIISHELVHFCLETSEKKNELISTDVSSQQKFAITSYDIDAPKSWREEFCADEGAFMACMIATNETKDIEDSGAFILGIDLLFCILDHLNNELGVKGSGTHPPLVIRLDRLWLLFESMGSKYPETVDTLRKHAETNRKILKELLTARLDMAAEFDKFAELRMKDHAYFAAAQLYECSLLVREKLMGCNNPDYVCSLNNYAGAVEKIFGKG